MYNDNRLEIEKQFKHDMGFSIAEAEIKLREMKSKSSEIYILRCSLNGFCSTTNQKINLTDDDRKVIQARIDELAH